MDVRVEDSSPTLKMWNVEVFMQAAKELVSVFHFFSQRFSGWKLKERDLAEPLV